MKFIIDDDKSESEVKLTLVEDIESGAVTIRGNDQNIVCFYPDGTIWVCGVAKEVGFKMVTLGFYKGPQNETGKGGHFKF